MPQDIVHNNTNIHNPDAKCTASFHIVPIHRGSNRKKWKAPSDKGWNDDNAASTYPNAVQHGQNGGLCHKQSGTCSIDIDNLIRSRVLFNAQHIDLGWLLNQGVCIDSGVPNRAKIIYRLPPVDIMLGNFPVTRQIADQDGMILEFRCVSRRGTTAQDVIPPSIHPDTDQPYQWVGDPDNLPEIPPELLKWWRELTPTRKADDSQWQGQEDTPEARQKVTRALRVLSPDVSYPEWRDIGVALHDTGWPDAFDIWNEWSSYGTDYDYDTTWDKWDDMSHGMGINNTKLYAMAHAVDVQWNRPTAEDMFSGNMSISIPPTSAPPTVIDNETGDVVTPTVSSNNTSGKTHDEIKTLCDQLEWGQGLEAMSGTMAHVAAQPSDLLREQYYLIIKDKTQLPITTIRSHINSLIRDATVASDSDWVDVTARGIPMATYPNFMVLAEKAGFVARYNIMSRSHESGITGNSVFKDAEKSIVQTMMESEWIRNNIRDLGQVKKYKEVMAYQNAYHPFVEWMDIEMLTHGAYSAQTEPNYIQLLADSLVVRDYREALRNTLVTRWLISVVASANMTWDNDKPAARGILTLQSKQHLGKSYWLEHLLPNGMTKAGSQINRNDMNHMKTATNRLIIELAETEFTHGSGDMVNFIKAIVGRSVDELRTAYSTEEVQLLRRSVFAATTNEGTYLVDGENTRWWTVHVEDIDRNTYNSIPLNRLWAQVQSLYDSGVPYILTTEELKALQNENEEHRYMTPFEEWLRDRYDFETMEGIDSPENRVTPTELSMMYKQTVGVMPKDPVKSRLAAMGVSQQRTMKYRYYGMPNLLEAMDRGSNSEAAYGEGIADGRKENIPPESHMFTAH